MQAHTHVLIHMFNLTQNIFLPPFHHPTTDPFLPPFHHPTTDPTPSPTWSSNNDSAQISML